MPRILASGGVQRVERSLFPGRDVFVRSFVIEIGVVDVDVDVDVRG